jgi:hypothetical protein
VNVYPPDRGFCAPECLGLCTQFMENLRSLSAEAGLSRRKGAVRTKRIL